MTELSDEELMRVYDMHMSSRVAVVGGGWLTVPAVLERLSERIGKDVVFDDIEIEAELTVVISVSEATADLLWLHSRSPIAGVTTAGRRLICSVLFIAKKQLKPDLRQLSADNPEYHNDILRSHNNRLLYGPKTRPRKSVPDCHVPLLNC